MAEFLFWEPYNDALLYGDFRKLAKAIRAGDPSIMDPKVRDLIAEQLINPQKVSRKTQARDGWPYAARVMLLASEPSMTEYKAIAIVLAENPALNEKTLEGWVRSYKQARTAHQQTIQENQ
ncbi:hypothetical protein GIY56_06480 [Paracoccus sp. YIM 132242]|uniref:Uncharacterized protein n=1 Tax=Paracoccus lichenicola TaxID=2665644 RepID=A0A6L6HL91_9RHOB|nr:hypothetical protein [Paracoccus lichenicola]MTD99925.1 hypothetical protein [Paracoccus lichenicola]